MGVLRQRWGCAALLLAGAALAQADEGFVRDHHDRGAPGRISQLEIPPKLTLYPAIDPRQLPADIGNNNHYVAWPQLPHGRLLVMLGGSDSAPTRYRALIDEAARSGLDAISLAYANDDIVGLQCSDDACYEALRGEEAFGRDVRYAPQSASYIADTGRRGVPIEDSIVMRLVAVLDYLGRNGDVRWRRYLHTDFSSPYRRPSNGLPAYPDWSRIVLAGHSQGGGEAAFMAMHVPHAMARVLLFSSPQDSVIGDDGQPRPVRWLYGHSRTPMSRWFGLRHAPGLQPTSESDEGPLGDRVNANWRVLGGTGLPGAEDGNDRPFTDVFVADQPLHRLFISVPTGINVLKHHNSTAVDDAHARLAVPVWHYLLRACWPAQWFDIDVHPGGHSDSGDDPEPDDDGVESPDDFDEFQTASDALLPDLDALLSRSTPAFAP